MTPQIDVYVWKGNQQLQTASVFGLKVIHSLDYLKLPFTLHHVKWGAPAWAKQGKLPVAQIDQRRLHTSTSILKAIDEISAQRGGARLYPDDAQLRADTLLIEDWSDEWLTLHLAAQRFLIDENFQLFCQQFPLDFPAWVSNLILRRFRRKLIPFLRGHEIGHYSSEERIRSFEEAMFILETRIDRCGYLVTNTPTAADFAAFSILTQIERFQFPELEPALAACPSIGKWLRRMEQESVHEGRSK